VSGLRVRLIEQDKDRAELAAEDLTRTVILNGDAMDANIQDEAGVGHSEMVICLTNDDKINILSAVLAKKIGARNTISLINSASMQNMQSELGIDMIIDPRASTISSILRHVRKGRILDVYSLEQGRAEIMEGEVLETSPLAGKALREADVPNDIRIGAVIQKGVCLNGSGSTRRFISDGLSGCRHPVCHEFGGVGVWRALNTNNSANAFT